ncbi:MAG: LptF/LptG family permease [Rhodobacteraceae bacterium]|nr:LptF/LptG family permease [Paracoccaceae bacterium]
MTLYLYFGRCFLRTFVRVFAILLLFIFVLEMLEKIRGLARFGVEFGQSVQLALFSTPALVLQALPLTVMLAALVFCAGLARSNEFIVCRAAGVPALRLMLVPGFYAGMAGLATILFLNPLAAKFSARHDILHGEFTGSARQVIGLFAEGFWLRQRDDPGHTIIHAEGAFASGAALRSATAFVFDGRNEVAERIFARTAILSGDSWVFTNGKRWTLGPDSKNPEDLAETFDIFRFKTDITPEQILDGYPKPETVPLWDKHRIIRRIAEAGFTTLPARLHLNAELAQPLMLIAMLIIGAVFALQNVRLGNLGVSVFLALACGFSMYSLQRLAMSLGKAGEISVFAAAWAPPLAAILLAVGLFLWFEDG